MRKIILSAIFFLTITFLVFLPNIKQDCYYALNHGNTTNSNWGEKACAKYSSIVFNIEKADFDKNFNCHSTISPEAAQKIKQEADKIREKQKKLN